VTAPAGVGLARVTVAAPQRRMDVALPDTMPVGELLPHLIRHAGEDVADDGERHGGWVLRRATGTRLDATRGLSAQGVRDGEVLHLTPARLDWPELAYDDVVEVIAGAARRSGRAWGRAATRRCGFAVAGAAFVFGIVAVLLAGPPWPLPGATSLGLAILLTAVGVLLSRALADATAGAVAAASGLPYAFLGGLLVAVPDQTPLTELRAPHLLLGSAALLIVSAIGYVGVSAVHRLFAAGIGTGFAGVLAAGLCVAGTSPAGAAAVTLTVALGLLPGYPLIASWVGRMPVPELPDRPEQILADRPPPRREDVFSAVTRSVELLTGMLLATAIVATATTATLLLASPGLAAVLLCVAAAAALLLRARLFPTPAQRVPLLASGVAALMLLALGLALRSPSAAPRLLIAFGVILAALVVLTAGLVYGRRTPSPYIGRAADILDVVAIMALIPLGAWVLGVFRAVQDLFSQIGG